MVVTCLGHNLGPPSAKARMEFRRYIALHYDLDLDALLRGEYENARTVPDRRTADDA
jgi:hypothetical protein